MLCMRILRIALSCVAISAIVALPGWAEEEETIVIEEGSQVSIEYTLTLDDGTTADSNVGGDPLTYTQGAGQILPSLESALLGQKVGDTSQVKLTAEEGYGPVNQEGFQEVPLESVPEDSRTVGTILIATDPQGRQHQLRVHEVREETIVLDFNHPLAGQALTFDVKILAIE